MSDCEKQTTDLIWNYRLKERERRNTSYWTNPWTHEWTVCVEWTVVEKELVSEQKERCGYRIPLFRAVYGIHFY